MRIPKKITPDYIKEAIVEVKYQAELPHEVLLGIFFETFDPSWHYTTKPQPISIPNEEQTIQELTIRTSLEGLLYNDRITIRLLPNSFVFNSKINYIGWEEYFAEIEKALNTFFKITYLKNVTRVGVRYINEYPDMDLDQCIKFNFSFGKPEISSVTTAFRSEFFYEQFKVLLNLNNRVPILSVDPKTKERKKERNSIADLDVIKEELEIKELPEVLKTIQNLHLTAEKLYFEIIKPEFLATLNPIY